MMTQTPPEPTGPDAEGWPVLPEAHWPDPADEPAATQSQPPQMPPPPAQPPGAYPPPSPPGGWPDSGHGAFRITDAYAYGWRMFLNHLGPIVVGMLVVAAAMIAVNVIGTAILASTTAAIDAAAILDPGEGFVLVEELTASAAFALGYTVTNVAAALLGLVISAGIVRTSLDVTRGETIRIGRIFALERLGHIVLAAIVVPALIVVGIILCVIPGVIVWFYTIFTLHFIVDARQTMAEALACSVRFVHANLGTLIGFFVAGLALNVFGAMLCGIGLLVTVPLTILASAYTYRVLRGEAVHHPR